MQASRVAAAWLSTRLAMSRSTAGLARRRARLWRAFEPTLRRTPALAAFAGRPLHDLPVTEVAELRRDYGPWNSLGCTDRDIHAAALDAETGGAGEVRPGVVAGYSTGSSGTRGVFLASPAERADYLGQVLARLLPAQALVRPMRVALLLRANSRLYSDSNGRRLSFLHLPLDLGTGATSDALARFSPTVLIAPPSRLAALATEAGAGRLALPALARLFYGAEPIGGAERDWIAEVLGVRPDPIYQATEGFIAAACTLGRLHLNEHSLEVELEPVRGTPGFQPVLTDLTRTSQPIVRVRTDDYLELDPEPCACGYMGRVIRPVEGRVSEIWRFPTVAVTPSQVGAAMDAILPPQADWQAAAAADHVRLRLDRSTPASTRNQAAWALQKRLALPVPVILDDAPPDPPAPKRRRVLSQGLAHG